MCARNFFNTLPASGRSDPTEAQLAWQIFTSLAYGAKGILWYCYWSPAGQGTKYYRGGGVIYPQGSLNKSSWKSNKPPDISLTSAALYRRGAHYRHARRLNSIVKNWGRPQYLLNARSTGIYRAVSAKHDTTARDKSGDASCSAAGPQPSYDLSSCAINNVSDVAVSSRSHSSFDNDHPGEGLLIGQFELEDGRTAMLLHNHNPDFTSAPKRLSSPHPLSSHCAAARAVWPTVGFADPVIDPARDVLEVDPVSGKEAPLLDDSPLMAGTQLSFEAGMARFLVLRKTQGAAPLKSDDSSRFMAAVTNNVRPPSETNSGDGTQTFSSLHAAAAALRARSDNQRRVDAVIELSSGRHPVHGLELGPEHSGSDSAPVVWRSAGSDVATLGGGHVVSGWSRVRSKHQPGGGSMWVAPIPSGLRSRNLWVDGQRAVRARSAGPLIGELFDASSQSAQWMQSDQ